MGFWDGVLRAKAALPTPPRIAARKTSTGSTSFAATVAVTTVSGSSGQS
jgi:hypothetical protein